MLWNQCVGGDNNGNAHVGLSFPLFFLLFIAILFYQVPRNLELAGIAAVSGGNQSLLAAPTTPQLQ